MFNSDAQLISFYMHEVRGVFCKTGKPLVISKIVADENNINWAETADQQCTGGFGVAAHIGPSPGGGEVGRGGLGRLACWAGRGKVERAGLVRRKTRSTLEAFVVS